MKKLILIVILIVVIFHPYNFAKQHCETKEVIVTMHHGSTVWGIAEKYIDLNPNPKIAMNEYVWNITQANKYLFENGRVPQAGDKIRLTIRKEQENNNGKFAR